MFEDTKGESEAVNQGKETTKGQNNDQQNPTHDTEN